jgi:hypothetical protein
MNILYFFFIDFSECEYPCKECIMGPLFCLSCFNKDHIFSNNNCECPIKTVDTGKICEPIMECNKKC